MPHTTSKTEYTAMLISILFSFAVATYIIPFDRHYWFNLVTVWGPHLVIIAAVTPISSRPAALGAVAAVLAIYLALFSYWVSTLYRPGGFIAAGYFLTLPGATFGAAGAFLLVRHKSLNHVFVCAGVAGLGTALGIAINQAVICNTVILCFVK